jgi:nitroreductase
LKGERKLEVLEAIKTRRSIRRQKPDAINDETLEKVLDAARWAPSWHNTQCWRFILVRDSSIKDRLINTLFKIKREETLADNPAAKAVRQAPVLIVACAEMGKSGRDSGDTTYRTDKGDWFMFDVALAMENLVLAAHALGLGTVIIGAFDAIKAAEILGVPEGISVVAMTPLGFPERESKAPPRKELSEIVFYDKYGQQ